MLHVPYLSPLHHQYMQCRTKRAPTQTQLYQLPRTKKPSRDSSQTFKVKQSWVKTILNTWQTCPPAFLPGPYTPCLWHWDSSWHLCLLVLSRGPQEEAIAVAPKCRTQHVPSTCLTALKSPMPSRPCSWLQIVKFTDLSMTELDDWPPTVPTPWIGIKENPNTGCDSGWSARDER